MRSFKSSFIIKFSLIFILMLCFAGVEAQKRVVQGVVVNENGEPLAGATITNKDTQENEGATDDDGRYSVQVRPDQVLVFSHVSCYESEINVGTKQILDVTLRIMEHRATEQEIVITAKFVNDVKVEPEVTIVGNTLRVNVLVTIAKNLFESNRRFILQPKTMNMTTKKVTMLSPVVVDGDEYIITQRRMYGGDPNLDPLTPYVDYSVAPKNNNVFLYVDSVSPVNTEHDFKTIFLYSIEDYRKQIWTKLDTMSTGVKNPLRFFDFSMPCAELTDPRWFPKPTQELLPTGGEVKLEFDPGKAKVDMSKAENASEINGLRNKLEALDLDPNSILKTFTITGTASPDGSYESNQKLASARMKEVTNIILSVLRPDTRNFIKVTTNARVAEWNEVADLMEADGLTAEADQIKSITSKYSKDRASQALSIRRLPFYTNLLSKKYLPMLRKVEYQYEYSQFRTRTDQEILEIYKRDPQMINTRYECSRLFETTQDPELLRSYYNLSLQKFPRNNYLASNRLACLNLKENKPDLNVLAKYIKEDAPQEVLQNQVVTALKAKEYQYADSVASFIYRTEDSEDLIAIVEVLNGNFDNASRILLKGGLNEVLVLLAMKQDDEALEKAKLLPAEEPINDYVRAIAFRRQGDAGFSMARAYLQNAVMWDESLGEIADMDGDLKDVWEIVKELF